MLLIANTMKELSFSSLMDTYLETNRRQGAQIAPDAYEEEQLRLAEQEFYFYLHDIFFPNPDSLYAVLIDEGVYVSALRLEPYRDGLLLEALETAPAYRKRGCAARLITQVQSWLLQRGEVRIYSHVDKRNHASLNAHRKCGFEKISDCAAYIDGSVDRRAYTFLCEIKNEEKEK